MNSKNFRLHHVGVLVADLERSVAAFVRQFGCEVEGEPVVDEVQTARVCFLRQPGQRHWLELITPYGSPSKLDRALQRGPGPHHLAYEVGDLGAAVEFLRLQGYLPLGRPEPGAAFGGRLIAWMYGPHAGLTELVLLGEGPLVLGEEGTGDEG
jgi:methylmalonyl-CoA/ethylmalonyl-CoA epimerase